MDPFHHPPEGRSGQLLPSVGPRGGSLGIPGRGRKDSTLGTHPFWPDSVPDSVSGGGTPSPALPEGSRRKAIAYLCPTWRGQEERQML